MSTHYDPEKYIWAYSTPVNPAVNRMGYIRLIERKVIASMVAASGYACLDYVNDMGWYGAGSGIVFHEKDIIFFDDPNEALLLLGETNGVEYPPVPEYIHDMIEVISNSVVE
ncbi:MAG: hypothetical protein AAF702_44490 [Chloroflexota bacterium]